jgi:FPC/CPF motif-containing protein YcgG
VRRKMRQKVYRETNKEKIRETQKIAYKKHYEANKEKIKAVRNEVKSCFCGNIS